MARLVTGILREKDMARNCLAPHIRAYARDMGFDDRSKNPF